MRCLYFLEIKSCYIAQDSLVFRSPGCLKQQSSCLSLLSFGIISVNYHAVLLYINYNIYVGWQNGSMDKGTGYQV